MISQPESQLFESNGKKFLAARRATRFVHPGLNHPKNPVNTLKYACARVSTDAGKYFSSVIRIPLPIIPLTLLRFRSDQVRGMIGRGMKTSVDFPIDYEALLDAAPYPDKL
jgi:hypothetical protein